MLVGFEVDACLPPESTSVDDVTAQSSGLAVTSSPSSKSEDVNGIRIIQSGRLVPQSSLLEIKTKSAFYFQGIDWNNYLPQLVISQTPNLVLGLHTRGTFGEVVHKRTDDADVSAEQRKLEGRLSLLRMLLGSIIALTKSYGKEKRFALVYRDQKLRLYEKKVPLSCLPEEWLSRFEVDTVHAEEGSSCASI